MFVVSGGDEWKTYEMMNSANEPESDSQTNAGKNAGNNAGKNAGGARSGASAGDRATSLGDRVVRLEELVSHQQYLLEQLDQTIVSLQRQLDRVNRENKQELERLRAEITEQSGDDLPHERPPHY